jgi:hypothetical protein
MGWDLRSKEEIRDVLQAAYIAATETARRIPTSSQLEAYLDGYATALVVVAQGLGVNVQIERFQKPDVRSWDQDGHLLPASLLAEDWELNRTDDGD